MDSDVPCPFLHTVPPASGYDKSGLVNWDREERVGPRDCRTLGLGRSQILFFFILIVSWVVCRVNLALHWE